MSIPLFFRQGIAGTYDQGAITGARPLPRFVSISSHQVSVGVGPKKCPLASLHQARDQVTGPQSQQDGRVISLRQGKMAEIVKCIPVVGTRGCIIVIVR